MRKTEIFNENWEFIKESNRTNVTLPHTWNDKDGQDGGNDYYRGTCQYIKSFRIPPMNQNDEAWLEFRGAAMTAEVFLNGVSLAKHEGGYSTFRVNLTDELKEDNVLTVSVDNSANRMVYPQKADFTFYGGIYRDVYLITLPKSHFSLGYHGGPGIQVTPKVADSEAEVKFDVWTENTADGTPISFSIRELGEAGKATAKIHNGHASVTVKIPNVRPWDGINDPYLYTATAKFADGSDKVESRFGCRSFLFDADKGFFLNGRSYPLCGVSRHQDREGAGNALTPKMHREDMKLIQEIGANTIRLAHYQHDQYFYDLCDEAGMIVWAEIPYITEHMPEANENTASQLKELVVQNYNHPSVVCWGLSNEITVTGGVNDDIIENHKRLNELCHSLDSTRPTTMAHVFMLPIDNELVTLPDICSYNLYYGWYLGEVTDNDEWFDRFHKMYPAQVIGLSEYGADANPRYQTSNPERGDYSETYQAEYHEHMLKMWQERPYIWAMHVWNMFDFAADGREEGGKRGINQKGLVSFDRKMKKDAFYIYKAYLSKEPFVHICGRRYIDRCEDLTKIKVYSNQPEVTLYMDGKEIASQKSSKVFVFEVPISERHNIEAKAEACSDSINLRKAHAPNIEYRHLGREVTNWFDSDKLIIKEGYYSIKDKIADIKKSPEAAAILGALMSRAQAARGDVAKNVQIPEEMQRILDQTPLEKMLKQVGEILTGDDVSKINNALSKIPKM